jgi:hypothetical protein
MRDLDPSQYTVAEFVVAFWLGLLIAGLGLLVISWRLEHR